MPRLPRLTQPQVATAPVAGVKLTPGAPREAFGPLGSPLPDLSGPLKLAEAAYREAVDAADQEAFLAADSQAMRLQTDLLAQAQQRRGRDALGAQDAALQAFDQGAGQIAQTLATARQRAAFDRSRVKYRAQLYDGTVAHANREAVQQRDATFEDAMALRREAATRADTPAGLAQAFTEADAILQDYGTGPGGPGWTAEQLARARQVWRSGMHAAVIKGLLARDRTLDARAYWEQHRDELVGPQAAAIEHDVRTGSLLGESQRHADQIIAQHGDDEHAAYDAAKQIEDPELRRATEQELETQLLRRRRAAAEAHTALVQSAWNGYVEHGRRPPADQWAAFTPAEKEGADARILQRVRGVPATTDWSLYYELKTQAATPATRDAFLQRDLVSLRPRLADAQWKDVLEDQLALKAGGGQGTAASQRLDGFLSDKDVVTGLYREALGFPNSDPETRRNDEVRLIDYLRRVDGEAMRFAEDHKRRPNNEELRTIARGLLVEATLLRGPAARTTARTGRLFEAQPGERAVVQTSDVPAPDRAAIIQALQLEGQPVTEQAILRKYRLKLDLLLPPTDSVAATPR